MNQNFLGRTVFHDKKKHAKKSFKISWFLKKCKKKFLESQGCRQNRIISETTLTGIMHTRMHLLDRFILYHIDIKDITLN